MRAATTDNMVPGEQVFEPGGRGRLFGAHGPRTVASRMLRARESGVLSALALLWLVGTFTAPAFLTTANLLNVGQQVAQVGIMAVGSTFVIITAEIDLSVGSIYALGAVVAGELLVHGQSIAVSILAALVTGAAAGAVNGIATVALRLPSFIVTLGTLSAFRGVAELITSGAPISLDTSTHKIAQFSYLGQGQVFGVVPIQLLIMLGIFAGGISLLRWTRYGFHVYAVGGSREAARLCGIAVGRVRIIGFVILGILSALSGVIGLAFLDYVQGVTGEGLELTVISAVIIGGTALFGGSGTMWGTLIGIVLIGTLQNILNLIGVSSFWQEVAIGAVIIFAVALDTAIRYRRNAQA